MAAVLMLVRSRLSRRWRGWLLITLLAGLAGGVVMTAAAGARRTDTAYPRFLAATRAEDVLVSTGSTDIVPAIEKLPQVSEASLLVGFFMGHVDAQGHIGAGAQRTLGTTDDRALYSFDTGHLVAGRLPDPRRTDEVAINPQLADEQHLHVGSVLHWRVMGQQDLAAVGNGGGTGQLTVPPTIGQGITLRITGILVSPDDVIDDPRGAITRVYLTPAFSREHAADVMYSGLAVRLRHGDADLAAFEAAVNRVTANAGPGAGEGGPGGLTALFNPRSEITARIQDAVKPEVVALWLFAGLVALCSLLIVGQAASRQLSLEADDDPTLRALGMSPWQLTSASLLRVAVTAVAAAAVAVVVAVAASPLMPIGPGAVVEPQPGMSVDGAVLGLGALALVALLLLREALPAWRLGRAARFLPAGQDAGGAGQPSRVAAALSQAGLPASTVVGVRMALEPGRGRTAVPVRSTTAGAALAVAAVVAALTFAGSLSHLVGTPRLFGWDWDLQIDNGFGAVPASQFGQLLDHDPDVAADAGGTYGRVHVDGLAVPAVGLMPLHGTVVPTLAEGRAPQTTGEIALGAQTLSQLHRSVGDTVSVAGEGAPRTMRIVGSPVFPVFGLGDFAPTSLGVGAQLTVAGLDAVGGSAIADEGGGGPPGSAPPTDLLSFVLIRFGPRVDAGAATARIQRALPPPPNGPQLQPVVRPTEIATYDRIQATPLLLAALLALLGVGTLAHALISAVRRRARDLAVLKTIGFVRRQVWVTVAWQATTLVAIALAVGVPLGIAAGRWGWTLFASQVHVIDESVVPVLAVGVAIPAAVLLANLLAAIPGRVAARLQPARLLRSE